MKAGEIYKTNNCGYLKVIKFNNCMSVEIEFINTKYKKTTRAYCIEKGEIKDRLHPVLHGIGFVGDGDYKPSIKGKATKAYRVWSHMMDRCYSAKCHEKQPTYKDCSVDPVWHNFQSFAKWYYDNYMEGCHLDKDIKVDGNKVYSPNSCLFVTPADNTIKAHAKYYHFISPLGYSTKVYNLVEFCRVNHLHDSNMSKVHNGKRISHKGWKKFTECLVNEEGR